MTMNTFQIGTEKIPPYGRKVIITGVSGQDGSHMADYLLAKYSDIQIYGAVRRLSVRNHINIEHLENEPRFQLINLDLTDNQSIMNAILHIKPDYFINFAAQSFVAGSWEYPIQTWETDSNAVLHMLEYIRQFAPQCRYYNAGSSEEFGDVVYSPQDEKHPLNPQSPYGAAKCAARHLVRVYRETYNLYAAQGWLFNHEGSRRGHDFVTRKISREVSRIRYAIEHQEDFEPIELGNLNAKRDWSDAEDFMPAVWMMLNQDKPKNYVIASGEMHSVRDFLDTALDIAGIAYYTTGEGKEEYYYSEFTNHLIMRINPDYYRPAEVHALCGDSSLAAKEIGWTAKKDFIGLVSKMVEKDYQILVEKKSHDQHTSM